MALVTLHRDGEAKVPMVATEHISYGISHQGRARTKWEMGTSSQVDWMISFGVEI